MKIWVLILLAVTALWVYANIREKKAAENTQLSTSMSENTIESFIQKATGDIPQSTAEALVEPTQTTDLNPIIRKDDPSIIAEKLGPDWYKPISVNGVDKAIFISPTPVRETPHVDKVIFN